MNDPTFRQTGQRDIPALVSFAWEVFEADWSPEYVEWKYFTNPAGRFYGQVAEVEDPDQSTHPLGFYGNIPVRFKMGEVICTGAQAVDAMIAPEARRLGLFVKLNQQTYTQMDADGIVLDYALPNPVSEAGFVKRLAWQPVGRIPRYMRILDSASLPPSIGPGGFRGVLAKGIVRSMGWQSQRSEQSRGGGLSAPVQVRQAAQIDRQMDALWAQISQDFPLAVQRDKTYLDWRYVQNPQSHYLLLHAWRADTLTGLAVISFKDLASQGIAALVEWLFPPDDSMTGRALLQAVEEEAVQRGAVLIQTWMLPQYTQSTGLLRKQGYLYSTARLAPGFLQYTTPLIIRQLPGSQLSPDPGQIENWYISMGDHDYF